VASWGSLEPGNLDIWDFNLKRSRWATIAHKNTIRAVAYSPDGRLLATAGSYEYVRTRQSYAEVRVWDTQTGKEIRRFENKGEAFAVAFSPDSRSLATASGSSGSGASFRVAEPGHVRVYDVQTGALRWEQRAHSTAALCLAYDPTGRYLASSGYGNTIRLWNPQNGTLIRALDSEGLRVASIAFFPDGRRLVSGGEDRLVTLWDVETGKPQRKWTGHAAEVVTVACASDGKTIASGSTDGIVRLWRLPR
jgi:WD40 repeat protein